MTNSLDFSRPQFNDMVQQVITLIHDLYDKSAEQRGYQAASPETVAACFTESLPRAGMPLETLLQMVQEKVIEQATGNVGPNMYGYVVSGGNQLSSLAEFIATTLNQNGAKWHLAPAMTEIEKCVVKWSAEMIGFTADAGGVMVSGGSEATLTGLTVARNVYFKEQNIARTGLFAMKPFTVYCSSETHNCADKSVALLGIGINQLRRIPVNPDYTIDLEQLKQRIEQDIQDGFHPFCLIGNAGTVNTGAIDNLTALAQIAKKYHLWFHVDGAYGGLIASLPERRSRYQGIEQADSVALDFHKWLYQPYEVGCTLVRNWALLRETYFNQADYLSASAPQAHQRIEFNEHYFQLSRNSKAFKVWFSLKAYGFERFQAAMRNDLQLARYLEQKIQDSKHFELKSHGELAVVCFAYRDARISADNREAFHQQLIAALERDGRVFITGTKLKGETVLRACIINHRKTTASIDYLVSVIDDVASSLLNTM